MVDSHDHLLVFARPEDKFSHLPKINECSEETIISDEKGCKL